MPASSEWTNVHELEGWLVLIGGLVDDIELLTELIFLGAEIPVVFDKSLQTRGKARRLRDRMAAAWPEAYREARHDKSD